MSFNFYMPVNVISGKDCVSANPKIFALGKKALIVTGKNSAKISGALDDVTAVLASLDIGYIIFDRITENPLAQMCHDGGKICRDEGCDFIVAIGGGSPIDGAKAISAYAADASIAVADIFTKGTEVACLPVIAIPTTAGTGSETNPYSVLTLPGGDVKKTFKSPTSFPKHALIDAKYTMSLNENYTVSCALDALAHAIESYLSPKASIQSELLAMWAAKTVWDVIFCGNTSEFTYADREKLIYASSAAGMAINQTGTGFPHPLGYSITLLDGVPHGRACGAFEGKYLEYNERTEAGKAKLETLYRHLNTTGDEMKRRIPEKANVTLSLSDAQIEEYVNRVSDAGNYSNSPYIISKTEMIEIYRSLF